MEEIIEILRQFRDKRGWKKYHSPKNLAVSMAIEVSELMEIFQWTRSLEEEMGLLKDKRDEIAEELADVMIYLLLFCDVAGIDILKAVKNKMAKNEERFKIESEQKS